WSTPIRVSRAEDQINQGATIAIDPRNGHVYVGWRRFGMSANDADSIMVARLPVGGKKFDPPGCARQFPKGKKAFSRAERLFEHRKVRLTEAAGLSEFDQGTSTFSFRSNAYPTMTVDGNGRLYVAWSERGFAAARPDANTGDTRVVIATSTDGSTFTTARAVDEAGQLGHQIMPTIAFAGGKLMLAYYDVRETRARPFGQYISDQNTPLRQTMDIRAAMGTPGASPQFAPSVQVSDYLMGFRSESGEKEQLQVNPPNLPMFRQGTVPFIGDYIDIAAAPAFVLGANGKWTYNTATSPTPPVFHAAWTDNRDVRPPLNGVWTVYTPPTSDQIQLASRVNPGVQPPVCEPGNAGSRNQNIYGARLTGGLVVGSPGNSKPLSPTLQRAFVVFAQNATDLTRSFRMRIVALPPGGRASFEQFPLPPYTAASPAPLVSIDMTIFPKSTAARTVYVTSTDPHGKVQVQVSEIVAPGAPGTVPGGLGATVIINPDIENPDIENPDIENPDIENPDIENSEVYNPDIENPDIENPDIENPDIENPDIENPDIENVNVANPDIENFVIANPDIENPDIENPDIENPDIENPDIENGSITDVTWNVSNTGNTTAAFNVNLFLSQTTIPGGITVQLILHKSYLTPLSSANGCDLRFETRNVLVSNVPNPVFILPSTGGVPDQNDPSEKNATIWLAPNEIGKITLRIVDDDKSNNITVINKEGKAVSVDPAFDPNAATVTPGVASQGVDTEDAVAGTTDPEIVTPTGANLIFLQLPVNAIAGQAIGPPVRVQARDNTAAVLPGVTISLSLGANPGTATLSGNVAVTGVDGVASFPALQISNPGVGYTLVATAMAGGVPAFGTSALFDVASPVSPLAVVTTGSSGPGSLRAAIDYANSNGLSGDVITFDIPPSFALGGYYIIKLQTPLPSLSDSASIDGTTQPGYAGAPVVGVSGELLPPGSNGIQVDFYAPGSTIRGLVINNFGASPSFSSGHAIVLRSSNNIVEGNFIGTDMSGMFPAAVPNYTGVLVTSSAGGNRIGGGANPLMRNVISGNQQGVWLQSGTSNVVAGNFIGTNRLGTGEIPAIGFGLQMRGNYYGVLIDSAGGTTVGGMAEPENIISGNVIGVQLRGGDLTSIDGNYIGTSVDGSLAVPNADGINAQGAVTNTTIGGVQHNIVSGNSNWGVALQSTSEGAPTNTKITHTFVGLNSTGGGLGNQAGGILNWEAPGTVIGHPAEVQNVISSNGGPGVYVAGVPAGPMPLIRHNWIGLDATGTLSRPNLFEGILLYGPAAIGGSGAGEGNVISGNGDEPSGSGSGVVIGPSSDGTTVTGNSIGPDVFGAPLGNGYSGITVYASSNSIIGGVGAGAANVISGNPYSGVAIYRVGSDPLPNEVIVMGNYIGTNSSSAPLPNGHWGISVEGTDITIGNPAAPNVIAYNGQAFATDRGGIKISGASERVTVGQNQIHSNNGLGIDLDGDGVTANDADDSDSGPNLRQNFPALSNARNTFEFATAVDFSTAGFSGDGEPYTLQFFLDSACDPSGHGQGKLPIGLVGGISDGDSGTMMLDALVPDGSFITAVATDTLGNSSEFSPCTLVNPGVYAVDGKAGGAVNVNSPPPDGLPPTATGVFVQAGLSVIVTATGAVANAADSGPWGPGGHPSLVGDSTYLAPGVKAFALVARIGSGPWEFAGAGPIAITAGSDGFLELAVNDSDYDDNSGAFTVTVKQP
ncbi:MAG: hypothetical protein ABI665_22870, partial [Vicinamibacterales bacterium]